MTPALELRAVSWGPRDGTDILADISLAVPQGQFLAICGANGAGKSSLLRLLYRFTPPRRGTICLMGRDLWLMSAADAARTVAAVLQEQPADLNLTVRQVVSLGRLPHRRGWGATMNARDAVIVSAALQRMELERLALRNLATLSGGERQRVMFARALAQEPKVIVLDEPTNHLDIRHQLELLTLLRGLGLTVIVTLHNLTLAADFADRVIVLHRGRILSDGAPAEALTEAHLGTAFNVRATVDRPGPRPRFSFQI